MVADIDQSKASATAQSSRGYAVAPDYEAEAIVVDVSEEASVENLVDETVKRFGRIDVSVHCAGVSVP